MLSSGNLDRCPACPGCEIRKAVRSIIQAAGQKGHIFNLGHGCIPTTPIAGVQAAIDAVQEWDWGEVLGSDLMGQGGGIDDWGPFA